MKRNEILKLKFFSLFSKDARIMYSFVKKTNFPPDQLFIHDEEPCPCGSGKEFSNCCKYKTDPGPLKTSKPPQVSVMEDMRKSLKRFQFCLHPNQSSCRGKIKEAHALQNNKIISLLAGNDNHVIMQDHSKQPLVYGTSLSPIVIVPFSKVSGNKATTQSCFCDFHDTELFRVIESGAPNFSPDNEQMKFLYAYKAFIFEYAKQKRLMHIFREQFAKRPSVFTLPENVERYRTQCLRSKEFDPVKKHFDYELLSNTYNGVETCVITIPFRIGFANYAFIAPDFDLNGEIINTIDSTGMMHRLAVTVFPENNKSFILLSCLSFEMYIYRAFFEQIKTSQLEKVLYYFNRFLPLLSENLVLSKELWQSLNENGQFALIHMTNLLGDDYFKLSQVFGMELRNAAKNKYADYSKRGTVDLFQALYEQ